MVFKIHFFSLNIHLIFLFLYLIFNFPVQGQENNSISPIKIPVQSEPLTKEIEGIPVFIYLNNIEQKEDDQITSTTQIVTLTSIRLYKKVFSPYLGAQCNFSPTCSEFGFKAIQKYGFLIGIMMTADRLSRDHGFIRYGDYPQNEDGHFLDPVEDNYIFNKNR